MATEVIKTVKSVGGDYASFNAFEAGEQRDLTAVDQIAVAELYSFQDTVGVTILGWTTDATRYIEARTPASERHDGKYNTSKYRLEPAAGNVLGIEEEFVRIFGIQITTPDSKGISYDPAGTGTVHLAYNIIKGAMTGGNDGRWGIGIGFSAGQVLTSKIWNNIIYDFIFAAKTHYGIRHNAAAGTSDAWNNTVVNCTNGFRRDDSTFHVRNGLAQDCTDGYFGALTASDWNISDLAGDAPGANSKNSTSVAFVDAPSDDYHLDSSDTAAKDSGENDPGSGLFSDDIDGETRNGSWDIGADEFVPITPALVGCWGVFKYW